MEDRKGNLKIDAAQRMVEDMSQLVGKQTSRSLLAILCLLIPVLANGAGLVPGRFPLKVSENRRHLVCVDGTPFLYHADTPWTLFQKLNREDAEKYLSARVAQGFTTLQVQLVAEGMGSNLPVTNQFGHSPFLQPFDLTQPNPAYFDHVAWVIEAANKKGLLIAMNPIWLGCCDGGWRDIMTTNEVAACHKFGTFLGKRFREFPNVAWIQGGDRDPGKWLPHINAIARAIKAEAPEQLQTAHASSTHSSLDVYPKETWLDFNACYTYSADHVGAWRRQFHVYRNAKIDWLRQPTTPFVLIKSTYEGEHGAPPQKIRRQAWWAMLSGAAGHAIGIRSIYRFTPDWQQSIRSRASMDMLQLGRILSARNWSEFVPDFRQEIVVAGYGTFNSGDQPGGDDYVSAAFTPDAREGLVYLPMGGAITVNMSRFPGAMYPRWIDPTDGSRVPIPETPFPASGTRKFTAPQKNKQGDRDFLLSFEIPTLKALPTDLKPGIGPK